jgi:hypothetical protein
VDRWNPIRRSAKQSRSRMCKWHGSWSLSSTFSVLEHCRTFA